MRRDYRNDIDWLTPALAMLVWAAHFSILWAASSIFPDQAAARWIALVFTLIAAAALWWLWRRSDGPPLFSIPSLGLAVAAFGVTLDVLPAIIG